MTYAILLIIRIEFCCFTAAVYWAPSNTTRQGQISETNLVAHLEEGNSPFHGRHFGWW